MIRNLKPARTPSHIWYFAMTSILIGILARSAEAGVPATTSISISAKSIRLETVSRRVIYTGNVRLHYKSLHIEGTRAVAENKVAGQGKVTITGQPVKASFLDDQGNPVNLSSLSLEYHSGQKVLIASGNVKINSSQGILQGQQMKYDMSNDQFSISGDTGSPRVDAVIKLKNTASR